MQVLTLDTTDGALIIARLFMPPDGQRPQAAVLISNAMGTSQRYYAPFAEWLARQGYAVATFDYRGIGESLNGPLRRLKADLYDWARDTDTAIAALLKAAPRVPLYYIGHSLGAQLPGLLAYRDRIDGVLSVASGSGYWRSNAPRVKRVVPYFWHLLAPIATWLCGYFPGRRFGAIGDLPKGVIMQWRRWCMHPRYHVGAEGARVRERFAGARFPLVAVSIADDEMITEGATRLLVDWYTGASCRVERIAPADLQVTRIGHFGFFRAQFESTLWARAAALLQGFKSYKEATA